MREVAGDEIEPGEAGEREIAAAGDCRVALQRDADRHRAVDVIADGAAARDRQPPQRADAMRRIDARRELVLAKAAKTLREARLRPAERERPAEQPGADRLVEADAAVDRDARIGREAGIVVEREGRRVDRRPDVEAARAALAVALGDL